METDAAKKRPLSVKVQTHDDTGGVTSREAARRDASACDAVFLVQVLYEGERTVMKTASFDGETRAAMSGQGLYEMWVALAGHLHAHLRDDVPEEKKRKHFLEVVLGHWERRERTAEVPGDVVAEGTMTPEPPTT